MPIIVPSLIGPPAGLTLSDLKTALKRYGFDDEDPLLAWINAARHEILTEMEWDFLEVKTTVVSLSGASAVVVPGDFVHLKSIKDVTDSGDNFPLTYVDLREFNRDITSPLSQGRPRNFTMLGTNIVTVYPIPDRDTTWELIYQKSMIELKDDFDVPGEIPAQFHYLIVFRAAAIGLMAENEEDRAGTALAEFTGGIERMKSFLTNRQIDEFESVEDAMGYFSESM